MTTAAPSESGLLIVCGRPKQVRRRPLRRAPRPARARRRALWVLSFTYMLATVALWLVLREAGDRWWPGTVLLLAPRWPFAIPLAILWPWTLAVRHWRSAVVSLAATLVMTFLVLGVKVSVPRGVADRTPLRLLSCNIHRQHLDAARMAAYITEVKPDVVALQGWSDIQESLFAEGGWEVHRTGELLVASRFPIAKVTVIPISDSDPEVSAGEQGSAALFELTLPQGTVHLIGLHLASPHAGLNSMWSDRGQRLAENIERRWRESDRLRGFVEHIHGTLILCGDFNTVSESPIFREHWDGFTDAFSACGNGLGFTYLINHTQIRIDHILVDASCGPVRCWVGPDVSAAHRPLIADIDFR